MKNILKQFNDEPLFDACASMLNYLHITFNEVTRTPIPFDSLYPGTLTKALQEILAKVEHTYFIGTVDESSLSGHANQKDGKEITHQAAEGKYIGMMIFAVNIASEHNLTRTEMATLTRGFNRIASAQPVVLFIKQKDKLALSTCERSEYTQQWRDGEKLGKVCILRGIKCSNPHRGHIDILETIGDKAYPTYEELYKHWMEVFSSELLTRKFYSELSDWYAWAVQVARFPNDLTTDKDDEKFNHESCIRLITRLIFVWFLKQKHLIPEEFFDERYIREHFIEEFNPHDHKNLLYNPEQSKYYRLILQNLFFAMLNCPIVAEGKETPNNRHFRGDGQKGYLRDGYNVNNLMRYKKDFKAGGADEFLEIANSNVPFLNGGLFDCLDDKPNNLYYDGFSERKESLEQLYLPDWLFFGDEVGSSIDLSEWYGDSKKKKVSARGIIDILKKYNFTIEENTPLDQEVSLDPELLGKAFENLLASYNPETKTSARKQTGSFYTPREIVQYMVDESLVAHLKRICGEGLEPQYRALLSYSTEETTLDDKQRKSIMQAIYNCRVLDPACGSGAFPMGVLQQMVHILRQVDPTNEMWKDFMIDLAIEESRKAFSSDEDEERKVRLADIEEAFDESINDADYARKLYLIEHCIYGVDIQPIAVQISKLRFFISLVVDQKPTSDATHNFGIRPLPNLESKFVAANTLIPVGYDASLFDTTNEIRSKKTKLKELNHQIFLAKRNVDKQRLKEEIKETRHELAKAIEDTGFVSQGAAQLLANWDMFDQNSSSPFFDTEWMFGVKEGFDIVIANPPYVSSKDLSQIDKERYKTLFGTAEKQFDLYSLFIEKGCNLACPQGIISYIVPDSIIGRSNFSAIRKILVIDNTIREWVHLNNVFESAIVSSLIFVCQKQKTKDYSFVYIKAESVRDWTLGKLQHTNINLDFVKSDADKKIYFASSEKLNLQNKLLNSETFGSKCILWRGEEIGKSSTLISDYKTSRSLPVITGKEARRYTIPYCTKWIDASDVVKSLENYKQHKVLIRQVGSCINATIDTQSGVTTQSVYALFPIANKDRLQLNALLGILNSKLFNFFYKLVSGDKQMFTRIILENIKALPYPDMNSPIIVVINQKVALLMSNLEHDTATLESEIDLLVYHLYNLTYDEVLIVDPETQITREEYERSN